MEVMKREWILEDLRKIKFNLESSIIPLQNLFCQYSSYSFQVNARNETVTTKKNISQLLAFTKGDLVVINSEDEWKFLEKAVKDQGESDDLFLGASAGIA